jgi:predicted TIM-barrel fold metal-dependent hydrolase
MMICGRRHQHNSSRAGGADGAGNDVSVRGGAALGWLGVTGWPDLAAPNAAERVAALATEPLLRSLRPTLQEIAQTEWILRPEAADRLRAMAGNGLCFDALTQPRHLPAILIVCPQHPDLRLVIDHAAKPAIREGLFEPWATYCPRVTRDRCHVQVLRVGRRGADGLAG